MKGQDIIELEQRGCFDFFWEEAGKTEEAYGLIRDNNIQRNMASIASTGFGLCAIVIGAERGYITKAQARERVLGTLKTMENKVENNHGFYYHFLDIETGKRYSKCELSIIDTAIFLMGALTAGAYFSGEIEEIAQRIYLRTDWDWYRNKEKNQFYMGYHEDQGGFFGAWDVYAEQLMMYVLSCGSPTHGLGADIYYDCPLHIDSYGAYKGIIHNPSGSVFVYQFSHAFIDFKSKKDRRGIDWFENSRKATLANRQFCIDNSGRFSAYHKDSWGMTACDTPHGYSGAQGALPSMGNSHHEADGTVPPCGAIGSIVFTPKESISAMENYYNNVEKLWGKYGFWDAYNLDTGGGWFSDRVIGIDKGISIVMLENYRSGLIWNLLEQNQFIRNGMSLMEIKRT